MKVKIVTPEGRVFENDNIQSITIPTQEGIVTIMDDHVPLLSIIIPGAIELESKNGEKNLISVSKGVLEVRRDSIVDILADTAERAEDIDLERAEEAKRKAEEYLQQKEDIADIEFAMIQAQIEKELARINVKRRWRK